MPHADSTFHCTQARSCMRGRACEGVHARACTRGRACEEAQARTRMRARTRVHATRALDAHAGVLSPRASPSRAQVPNFSVLRERLITASEHFNRKLLSAETPIICVSEPPHAVPCAAATPTPAPTAPTKTSELQESLLAQAAGPEVRNESLRYFSDAWNAVIGDLRAADLLSNHEQHVLKFNSWAGLGFSRCTYLPTFCTAGKLAEAFHFVRSVGEQARHQAFKKRGALERQMQSAIVANTPMREAVVEFFELSRWLLKTLLGVRHDELLLKISAEALRSLSNGKLLDILVPANLHKLSSSVTALAKEVMNASLETAADGKQTLSAETNVSVVTDKLRAVVDDLKSVLSRTASQARQNGTCTRARAFLLE
eukprot:6185790-Pleurochrysis_carterae.AAC.4